MKPEMKMFLILISLVIALSPLYTHKVQCYFVTEVVATSLLIYIFWIPFLIASYLFTLFISNNEIRMLIKLSFKFTIYWIIFIIIISWLSTIDNTTPKLKTLLINIQQQIYTYYKNNRAYPKSYEGLLENAGCKMKDTQCIYKGEKLNIDIDETESVIYVDIDKRDKKTHLWIGSCSIAIKKGADNKQEVNCNERDCIEFKQ